MTNPMTGVRWQLESELSAVNALESVKTFFRLQNLMGPDEDLRVYKDLRWAIWDLFFATASFYSHKSSVLLHSGASRLSQEILPHLLRESYKVHEWAGQPQLKKESLPQMDWSDVSAALVFGDHPLTGAPLIYEGMQETIVQKRTTCVLVSHHLYLEKQIVRTPYTAQICVLDSNCILAFTGARFKTPPLGPCLDVEFIQSLPKRWADEKQGRRDVNEAAQKLLAQLPGFWKPLIAIEETGRDRLFLTQQKWSGDRLVQRLKAKLGHQDIETLHLCAWGAMDRDLDWWAGRPSAHDLMGSLVLGANALSDARLLQTLTELANE